MKRYRSIVSPLSLTEADKSIVQWTSKVTRLAESQKVIFVHPMDIGEIPEEAKAKYPWLAAPIGEKAIEEMKKTVDALWDGHPGVEIEFKALDKPSQALAILEVVLEASADLVLVCRGAFGNDLAIRLARKAPCSVMVLPKGSEAQLRNITVPVDFSVHSSRAMDVATAFASAEGLEKITSVHVYSTGRMSHRATIPAEELTQLTLDHVKTKHDEFLDSEDLKGLEVTREHVCSMIKPQAIVSEAKRNGSDIIVLGCRGKDTIAALLLGSVTEELMRISDVPVIAAKEKGTGLSLVKALLGN
ncbi:MAG: universal stress protein [Opitutales bacterium]